MTVLVYQSNLWKLLEKVNVSITLALVPFHIGMVFKDIWLATLSYVFYTGSYLQGGWIYKHIYFADN